ncbi:MAG: class I SAM-dependent methyltransferase [Bdellovibrionales bacterium]|nr:class I SAM-dependent methyltransferase [Bdellovibrionales bacterium]
MKRRKSAREFDKYAYYRKAVQSPEMDCEFISDTYKELRGTRPRVLREDFCGTFAICCEWVRSHKDNKAIGIDLDPEPLNYGRQNYLTELKPVQQARLKTYQASVLTAQVPKVDVIAALNFSFYLFKSRLMLRHYFKQALRGLKGKGLLIVDCFGGPSCMEAQEDKTKIGGFLYFWEQKNFNPITHEALFHIHFKRKGEAKREKVFTYDWRMWSIAEIREIMMEAGFTRTHCYWEGTKRNGDGNGEFKRAEDGEECDAWVSYVVGEA